jgi:hypothetical protein
MIKLDSAKFIEQLLLAKAFSNDQGIKLSIENFWCCKPFPVILSAQLSQSFLRRTLYSPVIKEYSIIFRSLSYTISQKLFYILLSRKVGEY